MLDRIHPDRFVRDEIDQLVRMVRRRKGLPLDVGELRVVVHHHRVEGHPVGLRGDGHPYAVERIQARDAGRESGRIQDVAEGAEELRRVDECDAEP